MTFCVTSRVSRTFETLLDRQGDPRLNAPPSDLDIQRACLIRRMLSRYSSVDLDDSVDEPGRRPLKLDIRNKSADRDRHGSQ